MKLSSNPEALSGKKNAETLKNIVRETAQFTAKYVERLAPLPLESLTGQRVEAKDAKMVADLSYRRFLELLDKSGISPNRLVSIRVGMVLIGGPLAYATPEHWHFTDTMLELITLAGLFGDKVDGDLARNTGQCTDEGATLDAGADKVITISALTAITGVSLISHIDTETLQEVLWQLNPTESLLVMSILAFGTGTYKNAQNDIQSQAERDNNLAAFHAAWAPPLPADQRKPLEAKTTNNASRFGQIKTTLQMLVVAGFIKKDLAQEFMNLNDTQFNFAAAAILAGAYAFGRAGRKKRQQVAAV